MTIEDRWKEHCLDSHKNRRNKRPLYSAFNKYGIENFKVEEIEYVEDNTLLSTREIYWIEKLGTYGYNGYNATKGGDGKILYDYKEIIELYNLGYTCKKVADKIECSEDTVRKVLKAHGIKIRSGSTKRIDLFDLAGNYIQYFWGRTEAALWLLDNGIATSINCGKHITECCNHKLKSAYGYKWEYSAIPD